MTPSFLKSCNDLISKWEELLSSNESCEINIWHSLQNLASDAISRTAFGSSYEEGKRIFELQRELAELIMKDIVKSFIPFWRFVPTTVHRNMDEIYRVPLCYETPVFMLCSLYVMQPLWTTILLMDYSLIYTYAYVF
ncbi:unnamed protein product [Lathyrus sativus]|nr:unnamed protein product [Lathyrus sativus]